MKKITQLVLLFATSFVLSQENSLHKHTKSISDYNEKTNLVRIPKTNTDLISKLQEVGTDLVCGVIYNPDFIQIELSESELKALSQKGISYEVIQEDMTKFYSERAIKDLPKAKLELELDKKKSSAQKSLSVKDVIVNNIGQNDDCSEIDWAVPTNFNLGSMAGCLTLDELNTQLDQMRTLYPNLISVKANISPTDQKTHENRPVYFVKISDNPDTNEANEPQTLITGMTHAREVSSMMNTVFFMWYVLENYATDPYIKNLVDNNEIYFVPVVNPDGLRWNQTIAPSGGGFQRKNLRPGVNDSGTTSASNNKRGVDLNRNFGYYYGGSGSSSDPTLDTYRGTSAFSEPESQMMRDFVLSKNIKTALNHHAFSNLVPHPINGNDFAVTGREDEFAKFGNDLSQYNRYIYGPAPGILYAASGDLSDWMTGGTNDGTGSIGSGKAILAASPENGGASEASASFGSGFWPTPSLISDICKRAVRMNFVAINTAGKYAKFHDLTQSNIASLNSTLTFGIERLGQTDGTFTLTVTPVSSNILSVSSPVAQTGMTKLEQRNITSSIVLRTGIQANEKIEYKISLSNGDYVLYETTILKYYNPTVLFNDNPETDALTRWDLSLNKSWVNDNTSSFTGTNSIRDAGNSYANGLDRSITTKTGQVASLAGASKVIIQYYTKWDLERNFDFVQIQGSVDGTNNWTPLCGNYTKPFAQTVTTGHATKTTDNFQQTNALGGALYDGDQMDKWVMEEIVIDANNNSFLVGATSPKFRFVLRTDVDNRSDGYLTTFDGFYFDDFRIIKVTDFTPAECSIATTWNGTSWSNGLPNKDIATTITGNLTVVNDLEFCSMSVSNNANVIVNSDKYITVKKTITVATGATITVNNNANIIQIENTSNSGNIIFKRNSTNMILLDYTFWSSPVAGQNILNFSPQTLTNRFYEYVESSNSYTTLSNTTFQAAKGYAIRAPNNFTSTAQTFSGTFTGIPNNGTISIPITKVSNGNNLIGNPYPSKISATSFLATNPGILYFWTHQSQAAASGANYATFSNLGGTASVSGSAQPDGFIQAGQGFFVKTSANGNAVFNNAMRVKNISNQFFKTSNTKNEKSVQSTTTNPTSRLWLDLNSTNANFNQILIGYMDGATLGVDESIDGEIFDTTQNSLSSLIGEGKYAIQGRPIFSLNSSDVIPLGLNITAAGNYSITLSQFDGLFTDVNTNIYLKDNLLTLTHNLKESAYNFVAEAGTFNSRFEIVYENAALSIDNITSTNPNSILVYKQNNTIAITSQNSLLKEVKIFDLRGRKLYENTKVDALNTSITDISNSNQVLIVQIKTENNEIITKKIVF
jgi:hypothetical protein